MAVFYNHFSGFSFLFLGGVGSVCVGGGGGGWGKGWFFLDVSRMLGKHLW